MPLFEGGQLNREALGPLQNLFSKNTSGVTPNQGAEPNQGGWGSMPWAETIENFGQFFNPKNKNKQPVINKEDQTMRLPNFLFPKKHPKSILNLPGKIFNKENRDAIGEGYNNIFGEGGLLSKANFGGFKNPWAPQVTPTEPVQKIGDPDEEKSNIQESGEPNETLSGSNILESTIGGIKDFHRGFMDFDFSQYAPSESDSVGFNINDGLGDNTVKYAMGSKTPTLDYAKNKALNATSNITDFLGKFIDKEGNPITDEEEIKRILEGNKSSGQSGPGTYTPSFFSNVSSATENLTNPSSEYSEDWFPQFRQLTGNP